MTPKFKLVETEDIKVLRSKNTNYNFCKKTGYCEMWGNKKEDDIIFSEVGPFILDLEVSTICQGYKGNVRCPMCYKAENGLKERNMSFETFKSVFDKMTFECMEIEDENGKLTYINVDAYVKTQNGNVQVKDLKIGDIIDLNNITIKNLKNANRSITSQIAFGSGATGIENPEIFKMMEYCRENGVIPNITVANISDDTADQLARLCGAISVSRYSDKNVCYDSVKKLTDRGMTQVNIHQVVAKFSKNQAMETMRDMKTDSRLAKMNAIVFLSLKQKGNGEHLDILSEDGFKEIIDFAFENKINFGMDSCSGAKFMNVIKDREDYEKIMQVVEPCESTKISCYINVDGLYYSCSFCENTESFPIGVDVVNCHNFLEDVWYHGSVNKWRNNLIERNFKGDYSCPAFKV